MLIKEIDLQNYLFKTDIYELPPKVRLEITNNLRQEMIEIYSGSNIFYAVRTAACVLACASPAFLEASALVTSSSALLSATSLVALFCPMADRKSVV